MMCGLMMGVSQDENDDDDGTVTMMMVTMLGAGYGRPVRYAGA